MNSYLTLVIAVLKIVNFFCVIHTLFELRETRADVRVIGALLREANADFKSADADLREAHTDLESAYLEIKELREKVFLLQK